MSKINVGLIGAGTIGGGVVKIMTKQAAFFREKLGLDIALTRIVDKNTAIFNTLPTEGITCSDNIDDILNDESINMVIELVGGTTFAKSLVLKALNAKKHVVTANKALLSEFGPEIFEAADKNGVSVYFEAAVGGGMPSIKTIRESMIGNEVTSVKTIINGTCNYILSKMSDEGLDFNDVLKAAQEAGFAEADPTLDIEGGDTGHKVSIIASLLYGGYVAYEDLNVEGITKVSADDIAFAKDLDYSIKLLGIIKKSENEETVDARVYPAMVPNSGMLAAVKNELNAVMLEGDAVGPILLYGKGAGELPTASAVVSDIIDVAKNIKANDANRIPMDYYSVKNKLEIKPLSKINNRFYLRFSVIDKPKVLAEIASILGSNDISIATVMQRETSETDFVPVIILTHEANEKSLKDAIDEIENKDFVKKATQIIRIED